MIPRAVRATMDAAVRLAAAANRRVHGPYDRTRTWVVTGSPRSGTTWLAEAVAACERGSRILWEPLRHRYPEVSRLGLSGRPFVPPDGRCPEALDRFLDRILTGEVLNAHTLRLAHAPGHLRFVLGSGRWIAKFVRGNGIAAYLHKRFGVPRPVVLIRHPCAVVASQQRMGTLRGHPHVDPALAERFPALRKALETDLTGEEKLALTRAGDTLAALCEPDAVQIVFYEKLFRERDPELARILRGWDRRDPVPAGVLDRPSRSWRTPSLAPEDPERLTQWRHVLRPETVGRILSLVRNCGVFLYDEDPTKTPVQPCPPPSHR